MLTAVSPGDINNLKHKMKKKIKQPKIAMYLPSFKEVTNQSMFFYNSGNQTKMDYITHLSQGKFVFLTT